MRIRFSIQLTTALAFIAACSALRADDDVDWVQVHAEITYERSGTPSTAENGHFAYQLQVTCDQLLARVKPGRGTPWPSYVLLEEFPRVGKITGTLTFNGTAKSDKFSGSADLKGAINSLEAVWIDSIKPEPILGPGLTAEVKVAAKLNGTVTSDLPGNGSKPATAIFLWPAPIKYSDEAASFITEGSIIARPPFGPRPDDAQKAGLYDMIKSVSETSLPSLGGLVAPSVGAVLKGTPDQWELTFTREEKSELGAGMSGAYTHRVTARFKLVPKTLATPAPSPVP